MVAQLAVNIIRCSPNLQDATRIAAAGFVQPISAELELDVHQHIAGGHLVYSIIEDDRIVGFTIFNIWDEILYLSGVILDVEHQGQKMVSAAVHRARRDAPETTFLGLRTQSSRMWAAGRSVCADWQPTPFDGSTVGRLQQAGSIIASKLGCDYPIAAACYNGPLYGRKPIHPDSRIQNWWDGICSFERGDAVICVGALP